MNALTAPRFCLRVEATAMPGLRYVFKRGGQQRLIDPDLQIPYDLNYGTDDDRAEILQLLFADVEVARARIRVQDELQRYLEPYGEADVRVFPVVVDMSEPLNTFAAEASLLRLLPYWAQGNAVAFADVCFAWSSSRADAVRVNCDRLLYRRRVGLQEACFEVNARRTTPGLQATVTGRYGHWGTSPAELDSRIERFGFFERRYPFFDWESESTLVEASRALTEQQALDFAAVLRNSDDFAHVTVTSWPLRRFGASEGMSGGDGTVFAQAAPEQEDRLGFPHFLSVWLE